MKPFKLILILFVFLVSCRQDVVIEDGLPSELEGLKIHKVKSGPTTLYVATMDGQVNSITKSAKHNVTVIHPPNNRVIEVSEVIYETDSLILIKKKF